MNTTNIRVIDVLYRVSTRAQENEGESLFNQRREVEEKWAEPAHIRVRRRIEVTESGKGALRLVTGGFQFNRRAQYTELINEYQLLSASERPDAIVIDWVDRWSRNVLEYSAIVTAFRLLGIRLIAIGDGLDLTDERNDLITNLRAAIGQEQLRITRQKVCEARRSRRERAKWQGGSPPDGYRCHDPDCSGRVTVFKDLPDGRRGEVSVRACNCSTTVLQRDPKREATIVAVWDTILNSPLTWEAMVDDLRSRGFVRPNGTPFRWHDLYRIGENPHYAGILAYDRWQRDPLDHNMKRRSPMSEQNLVSAPDSIPNPYLTPDVFWRNYERRYNKQTRYHRRSKNGTTSELTGMLICPTCSTLMSSFYGLSSRFTGHGNPRRSPRKRYPYMWCRKAQGRQPSCSNKQRIRADHMSAMLMAQLTATTQLDDDAIIAALQLIKAPPNSKALADERRTLSKLVETAGAARHSITKLLASGAMSQEEAERDLFEHRRDRNAAEERLRVVEDLLSHERTQPTIEQARQKLRWLHEHWDRLTVLERAQTLRLLVDRITYTPNSSVRPESLIVVSYGPAFRSGAIRDSAGTNKRRIKSQSQ